MLDTYFPQQDLSLLHRILLIWAFIASGLVVAVQISQSWAEPRPRWTRITNENRPYWYTYYGLVSFLLMQIAYGPLRRGLEGLLPARLEVHLLDAVWLGLLAIEAGMLGYVFLLRLFPGLVPRSRLAVGRGSRENKAKTL